MKLQSLKDFYANIDKIGKRTYLIIDFELVTASFLGIYQRTMRKYLMVEENFMKRQSSLTDGTQSRKVEHPYHALNRRGDFEVIMLGWE